MADLFKTTKITQPVPGGPLAEQLVGAVQTSSGVADAGKVVLLSSTGQLDPSVGGGSAVSVNGTSVASPNFNNTTPTAPGGYTNVIFQESGGFVSAYYQTTGATAAFSDLTSGDNITATMQVGTGASLAYTGTGVINANEIGTINIDGNLPAHAGQLLISQPGNTTAVWADPLIQGLYPSGTSVATPINPVLIGGSQGGNLEPLLQDGSGYLYVNVAAGTVA